MVNSSFLLQSCTTFIGKMYKSKMLKDMYYNDYNIGKIQVQYYKSHRKLKVSRIYSL